MEFEQEKVLEQENPEQFGEQADQPSAEQVPEEQAVPENIPYTRFQEVISQKNKLQDSLENTVRQVEILTQELLKSKQPVQQQAQPVQVEMPKEPNPDDYKEGTYDREYIRAINDYDFKINQIRVNQEQQKNSVKEMHERNFKQHQLRAANYVQVQPDYYTVAESNPITGYYPDDMKAAIVASDKSPEIAYYLGKNQAEAIRIANSPYPALEIGKIEAKLSIPEQTKKVSMAPQPINPVGNNNPASEKVPGKDNMSYREYKNRMDAIENQKRKNGTWGR